MRFVIIKGMKQSLGLKFFPVPKYLTQPAVGLDISDRSLKLAELVKVGDKFQLGRFGEREIPVGVIEAGELKEPNQLLPILQELKNKFNLKNVFVSLPDDKAYIFNLILPPMREEEIRGSVELQLEEHIPLPATEVVFDYDLVSPIIVGAKIEVAVVALPRRLAEGYIKVFSQAGLNLLALETQGGALARALVTQTKTPSTVLIDIGRHHTAIFLLKNGVVIASATALVGGDVITNSLEKNFKIDSAQAEKLKIDKGLSRIASNKEVFFAMIPVVSAIKDEIEKRLNFWLSYKEPGELATARPNIVDQIILGGGQATLPGLAEYLEINLKRPVILGNPWGKIFPAGQVVPGFKLNEALRFSTALGLALRNFN